jgi:hypothetical protein
VFVLEEKMMVAARLSSPKSGYGMPGMCDRQARLRRGGYDRPARGAKVSDGGQSLAPQITSASAETDHTCPLPGISSLDFGELSRVATLVSSLRDKG